MKNPPDPSIVSSARAFQLLGQVGLSVIISILAGLWAGIKLDAWLGFHGVFTALGILSGIVAGAGAAGVLLYRSLPWKH